MFDDLFSDFEIKAKWRREGTSTPEFSGVLKLSNSNKPMLEISGGFHKPMDDFKGLVKYDCIWGETYDRKKISILDCLLEDSTANEEVTDSVISSQAVTCGPVFISKKSLFSKIYISISSIDTWLGYLGIVSSKEESFEYKPFVPITININDVGSVKIYSVFSNHHGSTEASIKVNVKISFESAKGNLNFYECIGQAKKFEELFRLLQGADAHAISFDAEEINSEELVSIYYQPELSKKPLMQYSPGMLFPYGKIAHILPEVLANWFIFETKFSNELILYSRATLLRGMFTHFDFLSLTQVVESMHRKIFPKSVYMDQSIYEKEVLNPISNTLPVCLEGDHRVSFKNRIKYGNEFSMRRKLSDLIGKLTEKQKEWIFSSVSKFISNVVESRNYYTHLSTDNEALVLKGGDLFEISEKLQLIIEIYIFRELGIADSLIEERFKCNSRRMTMIARAKV